MEDIELVEAKRLLLELKSQRSQDWTREGTLPGTGPYTSPSSLVKAEE